MSAAVNTSARAGIGMIVFFAALGNSALAGELEVSVRGVDGALRDNVIAHIGALPLGRRDRLSERTRQRIISDGISNARDALKPFGYYAPEIDAVVTTRGDGEHVLDLRISPGPPVIVSEVNIVLSGDGDAHERLVRWRNNWPLPVGSQLDQSLWADYKRQGIEQAEYVGFLAADFTTSEMALDLNANTASLALELDPGTRYVMGSIDFGEHDLKPGIVESIPRFEPGDYYNKRLMDYFRVDLQSTGWFTDVEVIEQENDATDPPSVDLRVSLATEYRNRYQGALGFGSDTGIRLQGNFSRHPMSSRGDRVDVGIGWREVDGELALRGTYRLPRLGHRRQYWVADGTLKFENRDLEVKRSDEDKDFIKLANGNIDERHLRLGRLKVRNRKAGEQQVFTQPFVQLLNSRSEYSAASFTDDNVVTPVDISSIVRGTINAASLGIEANLVDVRGRGWETRGRRERMWLFSSVYTEADDSEFTQLYFTTRRLYNVGERFKFILRGEIGYTDARVNEVSIDFGGDFPLELSVTRLPNFYRFRAGGSTSVRGYGFEQLSNNNIGSNNIITASFETEYRVLENWSGAVFADIGNAFNDWSNPELKLGVGVGIRWYSIAGPIRLDIAQATDFAGRPWRVHFTIGTRLL